MVDQEASGSCLLAGSWWIGSSSSGRRTTEQLAGPALGRAVGESEVHAGQPSTPSAPQSVFEDVLPAPREATESSWMSHAL